VGNSGELLYTYAGKREGRTKEISDAMKERSRFILENKLLSFGGFIGNSCCALLKRRISLKFHVLFQIFTYQLGLREKRMHKLFKHSSPLTVSYCSALFCENDYI